MQTSKYKLFSRHRRYTTAKVTEEQSFFSYLSKTKQVVITCPENIHNNPLKSTENKKSNNKKDNHTV